MKKEILKFLLRLNIFLIPLYAISFLGLQWYPLRVAVLRMVSYFLPGSVASGDSIIVNIPGGTFAAMIDWDCTGWKTMLFFMALVFAVSSPAKKKIFALIFLPIIFLINIIRIWSSLLVLSAYGPGPFYMLHNIIWPLISIVLVLSIWAFWMRFMPSMEKDI